MVVVVVVATEEVKGKTRRKQVGAASRVSRREPSRRKGKGEKGNRMIMD